MRAAKTLVAAMLAMTALAAVLIGSAQGHTERSKVKIKKIEPEIVKGVVKSNLKACLAKRKVVLKYEPPGPPAPKARLEKIGKAKTNKKGKWKIRDDFFVGHYKAVLKPKKLRGRGAHARREEELIEDEEMEEDLDAEAAGKTDCTGDVDTTDE